MLRFDLTGDDDYFIEDACKLYSPRFYYDENGKLASVRGGEHPYGSMSGITADTYDFFYNNQGLLEKVNCNNSVYLKYEYNADGALTRFEAPDYWGKNKSNICEFVYNDAGYVTKYNYQGNVSTEDKNFKFGKISKDYSGKVEVVVSPELIGYGLLHMNSCSCINDMDQYEFSVKVKNNENGNTRADMSDYYDFMASRLNPRIAYYEDAFTLYSDSRNIWEYFTFKDKDGVNRILTHDCGTETMINDIEEIEEQFYAAKAYKIDIKDEN